MNKTLTILALILLSACGANKLDQKVTDVLINNFDARFVTVDSWKPEQPDVTLFRFSMEATIKGNTGPLKYTGLLAYHNGDLWPVDNVAITLFNQDPMNIPVDCDPVAVMAYIETGEGDEPEVQLKERGAK